MRTTGRVAGNRANGLVIVLHPSLNPSSVGIRIPKRLAATGAADGAGQRGEILETEEKSGDETPQRRRSSQPPPEHPTCENIP